MKTELCYRLVEIGKNGEYKTLFHGVNKSRTLPRGKWLRAEVKWVNDGSGTHYWSGFHVLKSRAECERYFKRFRKRKHRRVVECLVHGLRPKAHSPHPVLLAAYMKVL